MTALMELQWRASPPPLTLAWRGPDQLALAAALAQSDMSAIAGVIGPKGDTGATGPQGLQGPPGDSSLSWEHFAMTWTAAPVSVGPAIVSGQGGEVWSYSLLGTTRFRFLPVAYDPALDAFYSTYSGGVLSGLIAKRG